MAPRQKRSVNAVKIAPYTAASNNEIVIKVKNIAINPVDVEIQQMGITKIPHNVEYKDAVVLPLGISTAACCLFQESNLLFRAPSLNDTKPGNGQIVLVWGGGSSVGSCGVQMLSLAGYKVVAIASKKKHDMIQSLGAITCFDQADSTIKDDIVLYLKGRKVVGAFDAISSDLTEQEDYCHQ
ncbi:hypothetical protein ACSS6W_002088 [Trichoderma asperelloides]